jgi:hypothetical protein
MLVGIAEVAGNEVVIRTSNYSEWITNIKFNNKTKRVGFAARKHAIL